MGYLYTLECYPGSYAAAQYIEGNHQKFNGCHCLTVAWWRQMTFEISVTTGLPPRQRQAIT